MQKKKKGTNYGTNTHTQTHTCTQVNLYEHRHILTCTLESNDGICAVVYWHNPWFQCALVKSCRAASLSDTHFLFSPIDYSFLSWQISPKASSEPDKYGYNKLCVYVCVCVCCVCIGFSCFVLRHKAKTYLTKIGAYSMCLVMTTIIMTAIYKCL